MYKIAIIAESDSILAFKAVGVDAYQVKPEEAEAVLKHQHHSGKYAVILISETLANNLRELLEEYAKLPTPAITILPLGRDKLNTGFELMRQTCIKATGTDIISKLK